MRKKGNKMSKKINKSITIYLKNKAERILIYHFTQVVEFSENNKFLIIECEDQTHYVNIDSILKFVMKEIPCL